MAQCSGEGCRKKEEARERVVGLRPGEVAALLGQAIGLCFPGESTRGVKRGSAHGIQVAAAAASSGCPGFAHSPKPPCSAHGDWAGEFVLPPKKAFGGGLSKNDLGGDGMGSFFNVLSVVAEAQGEPHGSSISAKVNVHGGRGIIGYDAYASDRSAVGVGTS